MDIPPTPTLDAACAMCDSSPCKCPKIIEVDLEMLIEVRPDYFVIDASTCRWAPGKWSQRFKVKPAIGNDRVFWIGKRHPMGGYIYWQEESNIRIHVLND